jgi:hypothetical protein
VDLLSTFEKWVKLFIDLGILYFLYCIKSPKIPEKTGGTMENSTAIQLVEEFKRTQSSRSFEALWHGLNRLVSTHKYFDPTGARTVDDFNSAARIGLYEAINSFDAEGGSTFISWARMRMHQHLIKEVRKISRDQSGNRVSFNQPFGDDPKALPVEEMIFAQLSAQGFYEEDTFEHKLYWLIIFDVESRIKYNRKVLKCLHLKLAFPDISRDTLAKMLRVTKPAISTYFETIRECIIAASKKYS